jgi:hypothetical protein
MLRGRFGRALLGACLAGAVFCADPLGPAPARAQVRTSDPMETRALSVDGELATGTARGGREVPFVNLALDAQGRFTSLDGDVLGLELEGSFRLGYFEPHDPWREASAPWAALWLGGAVAHRTPSLTVRGGVGVGPPLRSLVSYNLDESQLAAGWGDWERWLVIDQVVPFGLRGSFEARLGDLDVGGELALIAAPCLEGEEPIRRLGNRRTGTFFWAAAGAWLTGHVSDVLSVGLRVQGVATIFHGATPPAVVPPIIDTTWWDHRTETDFQLSAVPFVRLTFAPAYLELRWQVNLDEPHGPIFAGPAPVWALALRGGVSLDP